MFFCSKNSTRLGLVMSGLILLMSSLCSKTYAYDLIIETARGTFSCDSASEPYSGGFEIGFRNSIEPVCVPKSIPFFKRSKGTLECENRTLLSIVGNNANYSERKCTYQVGGVFWQTTEIDPPISFEISKFSNAKNISKPETVSAPAPKPLPSPSSVIIHGSALSPGSALFPDSGSAPTPVLAPIQKTAEFIWSCKATIHSNISCSNQASKALPSCGFKTFKGDSTGFYCAVQDDAPGLWKCKATSNQCYVVSTPKCDSGDQAAGNANSLAVFNESLNEPLKNLCIASQQKPPAPKLLRGDSACTLK